MLGEPACRGISGICSNQACKRWTLSQPWPQQPRFTSKRAGCCPQRELKRQSPAGREKYRADWKQSAKLSVLNQDVLFSIKEFQMTQDQIAKFFKCTPEQLAAQYARNADDLTKLAEKAAKTGKKVRGYTAAEHAEAAAKMRKLAEGGK